ncbi:hypothetical protein WDU94_005514, partial [Cyamophila willieti]
MLVPKKSTVVSQHYFLSLYQKEHQNIPEYVASLQRDIVDCEFNVKCTCTKSLSIAETFLRAQFIRGLKDNWIREQLLQSNETAFNKIVEKATALEASRIECKELAAASSSHTASSSQFESLDIHKMSSRSASRHRSRSRLENSCLRCGRNNHTATNCRLNRQNLKCNSCNKIGHLSKVCISSMLKQNKISNTNSIQNDSSSIQFESSSSSLTYGISKIDPVTQNCEIIDLFELDNQSDKYMISVLLNGTQKTFEVDSGAKFSLLSETEFNKLKLNVPIQQSNLAFRSYTGNV